MWKEILPENCPCESAEEKENFSCYRAIKKQSPAAKDFDCHYEKYKHLRKEFEKDPVKYCNSKGLSVYQKSSQLENTLKLPLFKKGRAVQLKLFTKSGKISDPKSDGHMTWWLYEGVDPLTLVVP